MFTGIIEMTVAVAEVAVSNAARRLTLPCPWPDAAVGQSVAVNGCCLTIATLAGGRMSFDAIAETLSRTNLGLLNAGDRVHLERSLRVGDRIDGHIVQGHVDGVAPLLARQERGEECRLTIGVPADLSPYLVPKGSVAVDGVSLTIAAVRDGAFEVALIPTTQNVTALSRRPIGWPFNLEADMMAKTIVTWLARQAKEFVKE
ncbi:MAG TPA: riboflavin synthase [Tepidisphaeraceae bacterium]|nr:riboflavin synthase [Tepidisphaeraceae bacterium]